MTRHRRSARGVALVMVMLASVLLAAALSVMLDVGTAQLRRSVENSRALQAQAGVDAGAGWFRALLAANQGDIGATEIALARASGVTTLTLDSHTAVKVSVALSWPGGNGPQDHSDDNVQGNQNIDERVGQLVATAIVVEDGTTVAQHTSTTLLRMFSNAPPYSEIVGVVDDAGPDAIDSPGDTAGQAAAANTTDLLVHAFTRKGDGPPNEDDKFKGLLWSDGNTGGGGVLP